MGVRKGLYVSLEKGLPQAVKKVCVLRFGKGEFNIMLHNGDCNAFRCLGAFAWSCGFVHSYLLIGSHAFWQYGVQLCAAVPLSFHLSLRNAYTGQAFRSPLPYWM